MEWLINIERGEKVRYDNEYFTIGKGTDVACKLFNDKHTTYLPNETRVKREMYGLEIING